MASLVVGVDAAEAVERMFSLPAVLVAASGANCSDGASRYCRYFWMHL